MNRCQLLIKNVLIVLLMMMLSACAARQKVVSEGLNLKDLFVVKTVTMPALATALPTRTPPHTATPPIPATAMPQPTATATPVPIVSPTPVFIDISQMKYSATDKLVLLDDITIPDGQTLTPGEMFVKSWRLRNDGEAAWNNQYQLLVAYTSPFNSPQLTHAIFIQPTDLVDFSISTWSPRQYNVGTGDTVDLVIPLQAPMAPGEYIAEFHLVNAENELATPKFWVSFTVVLLPEQAAATEEAQLLETIQPEGTPISINTPTPQPIDWTGTWLIRNPFMDNGLIPVQAWLTQDGNELSGYFYDTDDEPVIIEGTLENYGQRFKGKFAQPWQNKATPVEWRILANQNQFYSVTDDGSTKYGSVCGGRNGMVFPEHCSLPRGD